MTENRLKFRVYDIRRKVYFNDPVPPLNSDGTLAFQSSHPDFQKYYITEFCTGFSDKNGNLIYIGDIIKCGDGLFKTVTVKYANGENFIDGIYPFNLYHDCGDECHCQLRDFPEYACEIIGNIHEQAEQKDK